MIKKKYTQGFIALYFVIGTAMLFYSWMEIGSRLLFSYIKSRKDFELTRTVVADTLLCIDAFIEQKRLQEGVFIRSLYSNDSVICQVSISDKGDGFLLMNNKAAFKVDRIHGFVASVYIDFL